MAVRSIVTKLRADVTGFVNGMKTAQQATENAGRSMADHARKNSQAWTQVGGALTAFGAVTVAALGASIKAAVDWESAWAGVQKTVDGSAQQMAALEDGLRGMAREMPATHQEIAAVAEAAGALGVATKDVEGFTKTMVMLGETTNLTADEAATSIAQISNVMGTMDREGAAGVERFASALVHLGNNGASTEREILDMANRISSTASVIGMSESDVLGYANALSSVGIEAEAGGTAISRVFMDIASAASSGGEELNAFADVAGMSAQDFATAFEEDPARAVATFIQGLGGISAAGGDVFGVLKDLGMSDIRVSQALLTMAASGDLLSESLDMGAQAWDENTAAQDEYAKRLETTQAQMEIARNNIVDAGISLGSVFLPAIAAVSGGVADLAGAFADLPEPAQAAIGGLAGLAGTAALAGGSFMLLFPRAVETVDAMKQLGIVGPNANKILGGTVSAVGRLAMWGGAVGITAVALGAVANALHDSGTARSAESLARSIRELADAGESLEDLRLDQLFSEMPSFLGMATMEATDLKGVFDNLLDPSVTDRVSSFFGDMGLPSYMKDAEEAARLADEAIVSMLNAGGAEEAAALEMIEGLGYSSEKLGEVLPGTAQALEEAGAAGEVAGAGAGVAAEGMAAAEAAITLTGDALDEFMEDAGKAGAGFGGLLSAFDSVIEKNKTLAEETAAATESSKDSWEDYYDPTTVAMEDWLASLDEQIAAVNDWQANLITAGEQIRTEMPAHMQAAAAESVRELLAAGPEGAAALAAFVNGTPEERQAIIEKQGQLGNSAGVAAASAFEQALAGPIAPIPVDADPEPALFKLGTTVAAVDNATGAMTIDGTPVEAETKLADLLWLVGTSAANVTIDGDPLTGKETLQDLLDLIERSEGDVTIDGENRDGKAALQELVGIITGTTRYVPVDANLAAAKAAVANWQPSNKNITVVASVRYHDPGPTKTMMGIAADANGGLHVNGIKQYANGGVDINGNTVPRVPQIAQGGKYVMWAEQETGWEAYISGKPGMKSRNLKVWADAGRLLGVPGFADGAMRGTYQAAPVAPVVNVTAPAAPAGYSGPLVHVERVVEGSPQDVGSAVSWALIGRV